MMYSIAFGKQTRIKLKKLPLRRKKQASVTATSPLFNVQYTGQKQPGKTLNQTNLWSLTWNINPTPCWRLNV